MTEFKSQSDKQWDSIESEIRKAIIQLPDADEFTTEDIGRILLRVRRVNRDAIDSITANAEGVDLETLGLVFRPVYEIMIGEIVSALIENARLVRSIQGRAKPSSTYDWFDSAD